MGDKKDGVVKVLDVEELTKFALEDRPMIDTGTSATLMKLFLV